MVNADFLYTKKIDDCPLLKKNYSVIANFCLRNKIESLGELIDKYENGDAGVNNKKSVEEIEGFIDLIKYVYLGKRLSNEYLLFEEIIIIHDSWNGHYWKGRHEVAFNSKYINPLKRLGFNSFESDSILSFVSDKNHDMTIISALINYKEANYKWIPGPTNINRATISKKIDILIEYYNNFLKSDNYMEEYKTLELEELLKLYSIKRDEFLKIAEDIKLIRERITNKKQYVSEENIKKLEKNYNYNSKRSK